MNASFDSTKPAAWVVLESRPGAKCISRFDWIMKALDHHRRGPARVVREPASGASQKIRPLAARLEGKLPIPRTRCTTRPVVHNGLHVSSGSLRSRHQLEHTFERSEYYSIKLTRQRAACDEPKVMYPLTMKLSNRAEASKTELF